MFHVLPRSFKPVLQQIRLFLVDEILGSDLPCLRGSDKKKLRHLLQNKFGFGC